MSAATSPHMRAAGAQAATCTQRTPDPAYWRTACGDATLDNTLPMDTNVFDTYDKQSDTALGHASAMATNLRTALPAAPPHTVAAFVASNMVSFVSEHLPQISNSYSDWFTYAVEHLS